MANRCPMPSGLIGTSTPSTSSRRSVSSKMPAFAICCTSSTVKRRWSVSISMMATRLLLRSLDAGRWMASPLPSDRVGRGYLPHPEPEPAPRDRDQVEAHRMPGQCGAAGQECGPCPADARALSRCEGLGQGPGVTPGLHLADREHPAPRGGDVDLATTASPVAGDDGPPAPHEEALGGTLTCASRRASRHVAAHSWSVPPGAAPETRSA